MYKSYSRNWVIVPCFAHQYRLGLGLRLGLGAVYMYMEVSNWLCSTLQYPLHNVYYIRARNMERLPEISSYKVKIPTCNRTL
jgi:hypothetical protein